jgi:hypothetical protein
MTEPENVTALFDHLELHLGPMSGGMSRDEAGLRLPFQIVLFEKTPLDGVCALATLGLSNYPLRIRASEKRLRQELVVLFRASDGSGSLAGVLEQLGLEALRADCAYGVGDVVGPRGILSPGAAVSAVYIALPVYLSDTFQVCRETPEPVVFAWVVPIHDEEALFVEEEGRQAFESLLELRDPDLLDLARESIV